LPRADQALAALVDDLAVRGLLDEVLVVWMGDFGRTPRITDRWASRDHWPHAFTMLMAGAGTRGGAVYGRTDRRAAFVEEHPVTPADLTATIFDTLGLSPSTTLHTTRDGEHQLSTGRVLSELFT
jgi:arylsulfatase A-like enzyme